MLIPEFVFSRRFTFRRFFFPEFAFSRRFSFRRFFSGVCILFFSGDFFFRNLHSQGDSLSGDFFFRSLYSQGDSLFFRSLHSQGDSLFSGDFFSGVCILKEIHFFPEIFFSGVCILVFILAPFFKHLCVGVSLVLRSVFMFSTLFCFKDALKKSD